MTRDPEVLSTRDGAAQFLPMHLELSGRRVVVVGGGPVAARKIAACLAASADIQVVAPYVCEEVSAAAEAGELTWIARDYVAGDLGGAWLAFAATGDRATDTQVEAHSTAQRTFCVRADDAAHGTARSPSVLRRDDLVISVGSAASAQPADPRRAVAVCNSIALAMDSGSLPLRRHRPGPGRVVLVGGGPGDADLLTLRGRRELAGADVVVVDRLAPRGVLDELAPGVLVLDVGKAPGRHPVPQHAINQLLIDHARAGRRVVRLKGGDPFVLGRGGEEVAACRSAGIPVEVIPGVTSAFAVPAAAGIPVTHRGLSKQVTVLSGHDAQDIGDWSHLAAGGGTLVVLMGVAVLPEITRGLMAAGMAASTPVAVIEKGSLPDQRVTTGTVNDIAVIAQAAGVESPAVIVIGDVAAFAELQDAGPGPVNR
jgi:uroporphyrin-III C-methyltransferase/precorrin-2 dehydrogenase/sirohydrochlorin ferrochelatase